MFDSNNHLETFSYSTIFQSSKIIRTSFECKFPKGLTFLEISGVKNLDFNHFLSRLEDAKSLKVLSLQSCNILFRDKMLTRLSKNISLDVRKNFVECDQCQTLGLRDLQLDQCHDGNYSRSLGSEFEKKQVVEQYCNNSNHVYKTAGVASAVGFALLMMVVVALLVSERVRVRLYHNKFFGKFFVPEHDFEEKSYDVFISYAEEDGDLAMKIASKLEGKNASENVVVESCTRTFKCCLHHRDWTAGREIVQGSIL